MYVCLCKAVTDQDIIDAVYDGADNLHALQDHLGVATGCGTCTEMTEQLITQTRRQASKHRINLSRLAYAVA